MPSLRFLASPCLLALATLLGPAQSQSQLHWKEGRSTPGGIAGDSIRCAVWWDPDGPGPRREILVVGGTLTIPGIGASQLAAYDTDTGIWETFPEAIAPGSQVLCLAAPPTGELVIGGTFASIGGRPMYGIASYQNNTFTTLGPLDGYVSTAQPAVRALAVTPAGELVAGGAFTVPGGILGSGLAVRRGGAWQTLGAFTGQVEHIAVRPNSNLLACGFFNFPGTNAPAGIAEWDGSSWLPLGTGLVTTNQSAERVAVLANGDVVLAGLFLWVGGVLAPYLARWDGTTWSPMANEFSGSAKCLLPQPNGDLLVGGPITVNQVVVAGFARWSPGNSWQSVGTPIGSPQVGLVTPTGELLAAGNLDQRSGDYLRSLAIWDGVRWRGIGDGFDNSVQGLVALPNGDIFAYGAFRRTEGADAPQRHSAWNGSAWQPLGSPNALPWTQATICAALDSQGDLWMARQGTGTAQPTLARWNGISWQTFGSVLGDIAAIAVPPGQPPVVGTNSTAQSSLANVYQWNGTSWQVVGGGLDGPVRCLLLRPSGEWVAGGEFLATTGAAVSRIARFSGSTWQPLGPGLDGPVRALATLPNGDLVAGGDFTADGTGLRALDLIARWDGSQWQPLGAGLSGAKGELASVRALLVLPNGDLLAGGSFRYAGGAPARGLARWDGARWTPVDGGVEGTVLSLAQGLDGMVYVGGTFLRVGGRHSAYFARLHTDWPATVASFGSPCSGSAGPLQLAATTLPWSGSTYLSLCTGAPPQSFGLELFGWLPGSTPLITLHPNGVPGCHLLLQPTSLLLRFPQQGSLYGATALPNTPTVAGVQVLQQFLVGEFSAGGLVSLTGSNGLVLTIGSF